VERTQTAARGLQLRIHDSNRDLQDASRRLKGPQSAASIDAADEFQGEDGGCFANPRSGAEVPLSPRTKKRLTFINLRGAGKQATGPMFERWCEREDC
jgi:hypothetical protein